jgi:hypothetical protein
MVHVTEIAVFWIASFQKSRAHSNPLRFHLSNKYIHSTLKPTYLTMPALKANGSKTHPDKCLGSKSTDREVPLFPWRNAAI